MTADRTGDDLEGEESELPSQSFVLRLWLEEGAGARGAAAWRGQITHVASKKRGYVRRLDDIVLFVMPYLEQLGVRLEWCWRTRRWLKR